MKIAVIIVLCIAAGFIFFNNRVKVWTKATPLLEVHGHNQPAISSGKISFILDDWGYSMHNCPVLSEIHVPLAISVLPFLHFTNKIAQCADKAGKDVMLHLPLQPYHNNDLYPPDYIITTSMKPHLVEEIVEKDIKDIPFVQGVNNHMGSKAMENKTLMELILSHLKKHGLFFIDSMTSPHHSVCSETASTLGLSFAKRDVFLDNVHTKEAIIKQIQVLAQKARKKGYAIAIGHDRVLTMQILKEQIPLLQEQGFEIVHVRDLLRK